MLTQLTFDNLEDGSTLIISILDSGEAMLVTLNEGTKDVLIKLTAVELRQILITLQNAQK
jgi:hypothetical protein